VNQLEPSDMDSPNPQLTNEAYAIGDIRAGIRGEDWEVALFVNNITDERATYTYGTLQMDWAFASAQDGRDHFQRKFTSRPREAGIRFMKRWGN